MSHLDEGTIVAVRDGSLVTGDTTEHLGACPHCNSAVEEARLRQEMIAASLATLDLPIDVDAAKAELRSKLDVEREGRPAKTRIRWHLARAAGILLVVAGAAYAIPGSPIRSLLSPDGPSVTESDARDVAQEVVAEGGIQVDVPDGRIRVVLSGMSPGSELQVVWIESASARITAAPGSSFSFGEGRAEAIVAAGPVRVELPRGAELATLEVDGRTLLERTPAGLTVLEPVLEQTDDRIRFATPER